MKNSSIENLYLSLPRLSVHHQANLLHSPSRVLPQRWLLPLEHRTLPLCPLLTSQVSTHFPPSFLAMWWALETQVTFHKTSNASEICYAGYVQQQGSLENQDCHAAKSLKTFFVFLHFGMCAYKVCSKVCQKVCSSKV